MREDVERWARFGEFGNEVRVIDHPDTVAAGIAEWVGVVQGHTTPSHRYVDGPFVGPCEDDVAYAVQFDGRAGAVWIDPALLELVDILAGSRLSMAGYKLEKQADGTWAIVAEPPRWTRLSRWLRRSSLHRRRANLTRR